MKRSSLLALVAALVLPTVASAASFGLRGGLETPLYAHFNGDGTSGSYSIGDTFKPTVNLLAEIYPTSLVGFGVEGQINVAKTGSGTFAVRNGTFVGPNVTLNFAPVPLFVRAALPINVEGPVGRYVNFRAAGGLNLPLIPKLMSLYVEAAFDFPLAGDRIKTWDYQQVSVGAGLWFKI